jgi:hypothetical protein
MIMADKLQVQMTISPEHFQSMLSEDAVRAHIKEKLAYELAKEIMRTNRVTFTYMRNPVDFMMVVKGTVRL